MKEARNAIIIILVLLFILAGVGVAISRISEKNKANNSVKTDQEKGILERIFFKDNNKPMAQVSPTPTPGGMVITSETESSTGNNGTVAGTQTQSGANTAPVTTYSDSGTQSIPATGAPVEVIITSIMGLVGGAYLRRKSEN